MATEKRAPVVPDPPSGSPAPAWSARRKAAVAVIAALGLGAAVTAVVILGVPTPGDSALTKPTGTASPGPSAAPLTTADATPDPASTEAITQPSPSAPAPISQPADISVGLTASISKLESVQGEARGPGEVGGPAIRVTATITNSTGADVSLATTVVTAYYGAQQTPALELAQPGASPMPSTVAPGETATGIFVFTVPVEERGQVRVMIDYALEVAPLVFEGAAPA